MSSALGEVKIREVFGVKLGSKHGHPGVVLRVCEGGMIGLIAGTSQNYGKVPCVVVDPLSAEGRHLRLEQVTYFYLDGVCEIAVHELRPWMGACSWPLYRRLAALAAMADPLDIARAILIRPHERTDEVVPRAATDSSAKTG